VTFRNLCGAIGKASLLVHGLGDGDVNFLSIVEVCLNFLAELAFRDLDVVLGRPFSSHQAEEIVIDIDLRIISYGTMAIGDKRGIDTNWYSVLATLGTSMLWVEGQRSSYFF